MSKHTPGPWTEESEDSGILRDADNHIVAEVYNVRDVRLVAAAPELLEACREAVDFCTTRCDPSDEESPVGILHAAILKAEGTR